MKGDYWKANILDKVIRIKSAQICKTVSIELEIYDRETLKKESQESNS
jgi:hypothetical protein